MSGFTDIHSHFIYGIDDGAQTREIMEEMLDTAYNEGIRRLIATPHASPGMIPMDLENYKKHYFEAVDYCRRKNYDIKLLVGAENLYTPALPGYAERHGLISLAGTEYVLVEFVPDAPLSEIRSAVEFLSCKGYIPVIAHVERYANLPYREAAKLDEEYEMIFQMNCGTVIKDKGFMVKRNVHKFLQSGLISCLACDAHNCSSRRFNMLEAYKKIEEQYGREYADRLCKGK